MRKPLNPGAVGAGKWRDEWAIKKRLAHMGLNMSDVARMVAVAPQVASMTVRGIRNNPVVLTKLLELGIPEQELSLPENMKTAQVQP